MTTLKKLLIVEDDQEFRNTLELVLKKHFDIDTAESLDEALNLIAENNYDMVSTDGAFPQHKGGSVGSHGTLYDEDYRGNSVAKAAKEKGAYVVCVSSEPNRITGADKYYHKKNLDLVEYISTLKKIGGEAK